MNRMQQAARELTALCDSGAMAGSAMLSAQDVSNENQYEATLQSAQATAAQYAVNMFCTGTVLNAQLYDPIASPGSTGIPVKYGIASSSSPSSNWQSWGSLPSAGPGTVNLYVQLVDPSNSNSNYQIGNAPGRAYSVKASFGYVPTLNALGLVGSIPVNVQSTAATQLMNVILVFDCSGSMDDNTRVTFVERIWDQATDKYSYQIVANSGASNKLCDYCGLNYAEAPNGTPLNVLPPQHLTDLGYLYNGTQQNPFVTASSGSNYNPWGDSADSNFYKANPPLALDLSMRAYVATPTTSYPYVTAVAAGTTVSSGAFVGPLFDNDFGTPPGNCELKYGAYTAKMASAPWAISGVQGWDGTVPHGWGPAAPYQFTGYYNGATSDGNRYFYDPNAMPVPYTGNTYAPFTDLVVNLLNFDFSTTSTTNPYVNQPLENTNAAYAGASTYNFPTTTFSVFFAEGSSGTGSGTYYYEGDSQLRGASYAFPSVDYLVEASRGNLDLDYAGNPTNYKNALLNYGSDQYGVISVPSAATPYYQKAYQRLAMFVSQPFATAQAGAFKFFQNLAQTSAAYFGFVGFSASPDKYQGSPDTCAYLINSGFPTSLFYSCTGVPSQNSPTYADFFYHCSAGGNGTSVINPNVWITSPMIVSNSSGDPPSAGYSGPAASPSGIPYSSAYNTNGPNDTTWGTKNPVSFGTNAGSPAAGSPTNSKVNWAFTNLGFQIPRCFIGASNSDTSTSTIQQDSFNGVCSNQTMAVWNPNAQPSTSGSGAQNWSDSPSDGGTNGLFHCRPLTDTDSLEALESALADLGVSVSANGSSGTSAYSFGVLTGYGGTISTQRPGAINVVAFFTDGTPTDTVAINNPGGGTTIDYSSYTNEVIQPAQQAGIPIYSIGLALNSSVQANQYQFLNTLTNNGANGSQFFQVTDSSQLTAAFTGIAKQLTTCIH
jgi:hypothetical protein